MTRKLWWAGGLLLCLGIVLRLWALSVVTPDFTYFVLPWTRELGSHAGLSAFQSPFADYAPLYLYILKLLTFVPVPTLYSVKLLSVLGDIAIAALGALIAREVRPDISKAGMFFAFAVMWCVPTVILNGALWGQSDALYGAFALSAVFFMMRKNPALASLMLGISISFKLQAIFLVPVFAGFALRESVRGWSRTFTYLFSVAGIFAISLIPAILGGGSILYWGLIYIKESGEYTALSLGAPSFLAFFLNAGANFSNTLETVTLLLCAICAAWMLWLVWSDRDLSPRRLLLLALVCAIALPFFLPRMHERYFYLADTLSVVWALCEPRQWYIPVLVVLASLIGYMAYLKQSIPVFGALAWDIRIGAAMMLVALVFAGIEAISERAR